VPALSVEVSDTGKTESDSSAGLDNCGRVVIWWRDAYVHHHCWTRHGTELISLQTHDAGDVCRVGAGSGINGGRLGIVKTYTCGVVPICPTCVILGFYMWHEY
jgi:hypothetical protein